TLGRKGGLILHTAVTIGYDTPWRQVEALLTAAAEKTAGVLREPAPFVLQTALGDFYVHYELNAYTDHAAHMDQMYADLHRNVLDSFNEYGVRDGVQRYFHENGQLEVEVILKRNTDRQGALDLRYQSTEERLRKQFDALDQRMSGINALGNSVTLMIKQMYG
nr:mechanosensitive ion channel [Sphaerotilus sp.]